MNVEIENRSGTLITKRSPSAAIQHFDLFAYRMLSADYYQRKLRSTLFRQIKMCSEWKDFCASFHQLHQHCQLASIPMEILEDITTDPLVQFYDQTTYSILRQTILNDKSH